MKKYDLLYCMGDSFTVGHSQMDDVNKEINMHNRFSNLIASNYGLDCVNSAIAGCSNEQIAKTVYSDILKFKSEGINPLVVVSYTDPQRIELYSNALKSPITINEVNVPFFKDYIVDNYNEQYLLDCTNYHICSIRAVLHYCNFDFVDAWVFKFTGKFTSGMPPHYIGNEQEIDLSLGEIAGDDRYIISIVNDFISYGHPNPAGHKRIANKFIEKIDTLY